MRLSIEVTPAQHQRLKAAAALQGKSIKDYVLERTLPDGDEERALKTLETFLAPRIQAAEQGKFATRTVDEIFAEAEREKG
jgi:hypothetical protein